MDLVTSATNPRFRELVELATSARDRRAAGLALLDGLHLVQACRQAGVAPARLIISQSAAKTPVVIGELSAFPGVEPLVLADHLFGKLSTVATATGLLAVIAVPRPTTGPSGACLLLEDIQDPGNLGSILRTAAAAGLKAVVTSRGCADPWSPKVLRAAMGAHFRLSLHTEADLAAVIGSYPGPVLALDARAGASLYGADLTGDLALLLGNEGAGLSPALEALATTTVAIPMPGGMESLGVAASAAVCLFERVRQLSGARTAAPLGPRAG